MENTMYPQQYLEVEFQGQMLHIILFHSLSLINGIEVRVWQVE